MKNAILPLCLCAILLVGAGCSKAVPADVSTPVATNSVVSMGSSPCGDGTCDAAERADATLCPSDCGTAASASTTGTETSSTGTFAFAPDAGIRMENASNAGVRLAEDGTLSLLFQDSVGGGSKIATASKSSDWLDFTVVDTHADPAVFRALRFADGTCRAYGLDATKSGVLPGSTGLKSRSSKDCVTFTEDAGTRYELSESDKGSMGVYDLFVDSKGGVVLLYLGDMHGANNLRRAYSTDGGWTFALQNENVLGDAGSKDGTFVDNKEIVLADGTVRMIAMRFGSVYTFTSTDDGVTWTQDPGSLKPSDFAGQNLVGFNDPQLILLPDGRFRIYTAGRYPGDRPGEENLKVNMYSATTR